MPGKLGIPTITLVTSSSVKIACKPPAHSDNSKAMKYVTKYRKDGQSKWDWLPETSKVEQTVRGLDEDTIYDIKVAAKYEGGKLGPQSDVARVKTKKNTPGKYWQYVTEALIVELRFIPLYTSMYNEDLDTIVLRSTSDWRLIVV